jgi:hypothetical protein
MKYILITKDGKIMMFYILNVAVMYKSLCGGTIFLADEFDNMERVDEKAQ